VAAGPQSPPHHSDVALPRLGIDEEVEHGTVVPEIETCFGQLGARDVGG
jgi:hypothetical protein